jgi:hypothetical protein
MVVNGEANSRASHDQTFSKKYENMHYYTSCLLAINMCCGCAEFTTHCLHLVIKFVK